MSKSFIGQFRIPPPTKEAQQWFKPIESRNIPTSGINEDNFIVNPSNKENLSYDSSDRNEKYFLFYKNEKIKSVHSLDDAKQIILDLMENSEIDLEGFTLFKKIPISLELCFEDK